MKHSKTIVLPDGYNGHTAKFFAEPIARDGNLVKLRCAEPGREYQFRWAHVTAIEPTSHKATVLA